MADAATTYVTAHNAQRCIRRKQAPASRRHAYARPASSSSGCSALCHAADTPDLARREPYNSRDRHAALVDIALGLCTDSLDRASAAMVAALDSVAARPDSEAAEAALEHAEALMASMLRRLQLTQALVAVQALRRGGHTTVPPQLVVQLGLGGLNAAAAAADEEAEDEACSSWQPPRL